MEAHYAFYINNVLVWSGTDTAFTTGQVALWTYGSDVLYADWATLGAPGASAAESVEQGQLNLSRLGAVCKRILPVAVAASGVKI